MVPGLLCITSCCTAPGTSILPLLGFPASGAGSAGTRGALPAAGPCAGGKMAGAGGSLVAHFDADLDRPGRRYGAGHVDRGIAGVANLAVGDADGVAIGGVAIALFGDDQHAPVAVKAGGQRRAAITGPRPTHQKGSKK